MCFQSQPTATIFLRTTPPPDGQEPLQQGYVLDESVKLGSLEGSHFSLIRAEPKFADRQQRLILKSFEKPLIMPIK